MLSVRWPVWAGPERIVEAVLRAAEGGSSRAESGSWIAAGGLRARLDWFGTWQAATLSNPVRRGRRAEVATLRGLLRSGRLVTVVGLGGAGKTRVAAELVSDRDCLWIDLSDANDPSDVAAAVAESLGLPA